MTYGIDQAGVFFAKQSPTPDQILVSVVNRTETHRVSQVFPNTDEGEKDAVEWSLNVDFNTASAKCPKCQHDSHLSEHCNVMVKTGAFSYEGGEYESQCDCGMN